MDFNDFIIPELLVLIPALYIIGEIVKSSLGEAGNRHIPAILGMVGIILAVIWELSVCRDNLALAVFTAIVQGILCAGAAVYANQILKQLNK